MAADQTLDYVQQQVQKEIDRVAEIIVEGTCKTLEDYRFKAGTIQGLEIAKRFIMETQRRLENA